MKVSFFDTKANSQEKYTLQKTEKSVFRKSEISICGYNMLLHAEYLTLPIVRLQCLFCDVFFPLEHSIEFLNIRSSRKYDPVVFLSESKKAFCPKAKI